MGESVGLIKLPGSDFAGVFVPGNDSLRPSATRGGPNPNDFGEILCIGEISASTRLDGKGRFRRDRSLGERDELGDLQRRVLRRSSLDRPLRVFPDCWPIRFPMHSVRHSLTHGSFETAVRLTTSPPSNVSVTSGIAAWVRSNSYLP